MRHEMINRVLDKLISVIRPIPFRGKFRLLSPLVPEQGIRTARIFDTLFELDLAEWCQRKIYLGAYEPRETRLMIEMLKPGMTVVDIGANIGYYTALAASRTGPGGRVFAIEPEARSFSALKRMIGGNHITAVARAFNFGLGERQDEQHLYLSPSSTNNSPTMIPHGNFASSATVPVRTLDDCLDEWNVSQVDLIKIDVEGWEPRIFAGARRCLSAGRIDAILCEFNDFWLRAGGSSPQDLLKTLTDFGFHLALPGDMKRLAGEKLVTCLLVR
jgi:FkbM family methyltransferase